ncbi:NINE protein [Bacillus paralicheniformis]|nr:NINE protein [Bacillus paralicheniformis]
MGFLGVVAAHRFYLDERTGYAAAKLLLNWIRFGLLLRYDLPCENNGRIK